MFHFLFRIEDYQSNFPSSLLRFITAQSNELARQCVEPSATRLNKSSNKKISKSNQPFEPSPSLEKVALFIIQSVKTISSEKCQFCSNACLPPNPEVR